MTSRTLRIVITDIEAEWLVPVTASISWVLKLTSSRTRHGVQEFLRRNNIPVTEFVDEKELIVDPSELQEVSIKESNIATKELLERLNDDEY